MLEFKKTEIKSEENTYYTFTFTTLEGSFQIIFSGNLDLYWRCLDRIESDQESIQYTITKENYPIYLLFEELYERVRDYNIFNSKKLNENLKKRDKRNSQRLFQDGVIEYHCDDYDYDESDMFKIKPTEEGFAIIFEKGNRAKEYKRSCAIRIRNSGSRYNNFNIIFMEVYKKLKEYFKEDHQITIDEIMWQKRYGTRNSKFPK
ncbi:MAG: hypothetical protein PHD02_00100 [Bacilli bacterium]|nr:hypothetical protein [Bacilli bacterium]